ncbi:dTDP-4-dehydrorhamnose 3,5-epimerase [Gilvimarinus sp. SDUM040013]|uniref:dTDP-4-dehydrorhamnose 3,5-epimerase n=1 Tax=Gilvimarinus gilvus TaxID=3058038 RepID=A0ABU4RWI9_9GAMM|nr:dTDP-4-dehydrorhamnose 3,5-epimerase [Gilvimarinus sp. SDUM040013]MDO3385232.1 dTDP-4-dehydrorhamnose 3,5-epimerase [Gilvimarinus sp. SDUM040013]MDX6849215.1 dTDP-4-dehydrorhamnose 3,5-epimerase [Gilvimarinus sp. SDUM040013]
MKITPQTIADVLLIEPKVFGDERGYFFESFRQDLFEAATGYPVNFIQDNESKSGKGVLRNLHFQRPPYAQSKLVRVIEGDVLDIAVDLRQGSPAFGQHASARLSGKNKHQLFIPRGFAHGFIVLSETATFVYKVDNVYAPEHDCGIYYADTSLGIDWQLPQQDIKTSEKDATLPTLAELTESTPEALFQYGSTLYD